jgi:hypothetical protein
VLGYFALKLTGGIRVDSFAIKSVFGAVIASMISGLVILGGFVATLFVIRAPEMKLIAKLAGPAVAKVRGIIGR